MEIKPSTDIFPRNLICVIREFHIKRQSVLSSTLSFCALVTNFKKTYVNSFYTNQNKVSSIKASSILYFDSQLVLKISNINVKVKKGYYFVKTERSKLKTEPLRGNWINSLENTKTRSLFSSIPVMECEPLKASSAKNVWSFCAEFILTWLMKPNYIIISLPLTCPFVYFTLTDLASGDIQGLLLYFWLFFVFAAVCVCLCVCVLIIIILDSGALYLSSI